MSEMKWETMEGGELFKWDTAGKNLQGVLVKYKHQRDTGKGVGNVYEVKTAKGRTAFFAPTMLHSQLADVKIPSIVNITLTEIGQTKTGNTLKKFKVNYAPSTPENLKIIGVELTGNEEVDEGGDLDAAWDDMDKK